MNYSITTLGKNHRRFHLVGPGITRSSRGLTPMMWVENHQVPACEWVWPSTTITRRKCRRKTEARGDSGHRG